MTAQVAERIKAPSHRDIIAGMIQEYDQAEQRVMRMVAAQTDFREIMLQNNRQRRAALQAALAGLVSSG